MPMQVPVLTGLILLAACGCTDLKQSAYATVQNLQQQQCQRAMQDDCVNKQSYSHYLRDRAAATQ